MPWAAASASEIPAPLAVTRSGSAISHRYLSGDTSAQVAARDYFVAPGSEVLQTSGIYLSKARSLAVFIEQ
jgi:hypothetical protein